ncbi:MAG: molybdopterin-dependent oxidoreductase [Candidatus Devosia symbiotica]|nr:molybdopterin-dependent oxidoreductase [Candidatus Devosia symbiotica]
MGHVQRDDIDRLRVAKGYSRQYDTICTGAAWLGYIAGIGMLGGVNPEQMAESDCVVIWDTNAVHIQVNVMIHAIRAKKERGAKLVVIDIYQIATQAQADLGLVLRPGTDGALAVAVMHILLRDNLANRAYKAKFTDFGPDFKAHLADKTPQWAADITGLSVAEITEFTHLVGTTPKSYFRLGYGFARQRNGSTAMHAALCIQAMIGAWQHRGGAIFTGNTGALKGGGPVQAMIVQNTNLASVAPDQNLTRRGLEREDLFLVVHEQFMTETAELADIVLLATMFSNTMTTTPTCFTPRLSSHAPIRPAQIMRSSTLWRSASDWTMTAFGPPIETSSPTPSAAPAIPAWNRSKSPVSLIANALMRSPVSPMALPGPTSASALRQTGRMWPVGRAISGSAIRPTCGALPPNCSITKAANAAYPFRLVTSPARGFLNSSFNETLAARSARVRYRYSSIPMMRLGLVLPRAISSPSATGTVRLI